MSRVAYIASVAGPGVPGATLPAGKRRCLFPGHAEESTTVDGVPFTAFPARAVYTTWFNAWHLYEVIDVPLSFDFGAGSFVYADTIPCGYAIPPGRPADETSRVYPDCGRWSAIVGDGITTPLVTLDIFMLGADNPCYYWRKDFDPPQMVPKFAITGSIVWDQGTELVANFSSGTQPAPGPDYFEDSADFLGIPISFWCEPNVSKTSFTLGYVRGENWPYLNAAGGEAIFNVLTGAQIRSQWPIYSGNQPI
jgi:hypothetical protein